MEEICSVLSLAGAQLAFFFRWCIRFCTTFLSLPDEHFIECEKLLCCCTVKLVKLYFMLQKNDMKLNRDKIRKLSDRRRHNIL